MKLLEINEFNHLRIDRIESIELIESYPIPKINILMFNGDKKILEFNTLKRAKDNYNNVLTMIKNCDKLEKED